MSIYKISPGKIDLSTIANATRKRQKITLSEKARIRIERCRSYLDKKLKKNQEAIYGINTGFGALYNKSIPEKDLEKLQQNLVMSHACGTGEEVPPGIVRLMLLLKAQALSYGNSGVQLATVERLADFYNYDILPVIYQQGSLGASGDLAPLAHLALPLIGKGEVYFSGKRMTASGALEKMKWKPLRFRSKEALALLNGTQFMSAYGVWCVSEALRLAALADFTGAVSLEAFDGRIEPFHQLVHKVRPHEGQAMVAENFRSILKGSELTRRKKQHVQDPYSLRCIPQVHGASRDAIAYAVKTVETEINSVTDNPTIFPDENKIISGGNFHGQPLALALDFLSMALAELGSISERRTYLLVSGQRGLPPFLVANAGLNSGFMIPQYTAASIVSQNKQLCTPASVDTVMSSNGQEDHVSMGANAATKCFRVVQNLEQVLAIEFFTAAQAFEFRRPAKSSSHVESLISSYRSLVPFLDEDQPMYPWIKKTVQFLRTAPIG